MMEIKHTIKYPYPLRTLPDIKFAVNKNFEESRTKKVMCSKIRKLIKLSKFSWHKPLLNCFLFTASVIDPLQRLHGKKYRIFTYSSDAVILWKRTVSAEFRASL